MSIRESDSQPVLRSYTQAQRNIAESFEQVYMSIEILHESQEVRPVASEREKEGR